MTTDVLPYEKMKLRLLNASHQALCYIGMLLGYQLVHETMRDQDIRELVEKMMDDEVTPILSAVPGVDLAEYKKTLIERFGNPAIRDQLSRIGIYGSSGIPKFVLPSIEEQLQRRGPIKLLAEYLCRCLSSFSFSIIFTICACVSAAFRRHRITKSSA
jgi:mannitol 2-dehydrogenase